MEQPTNSKRLLKVLRHLWSLKISLLHCFLGTLFGSLLLILSLSYRVAPKHAKVLSFL